MVLWTQKNRIAVRPTDRPMRYHSGTPVLLTRIMDFFNNRLGLE